MATAQSPLLPGAAIFSLSSQHWTWSDENDPFEAMPESELDFLTDDFVPSNSQQESFASQASSSQDALPASSSSPEDSNTADPQFTPSSTADDSPGGIDHSDHASFEFVSENTDSPAGTFDEASLMNSDFSGHSPVYQRILPASDATLSSSQQSREQSDGPTWGAQEQNWSPSFTTSSEGYAPSASPYNGFVTTESTSAASNSLLADLTIPIRLSQSFEPWATTAVRSITWGNPQQPMFPIQQQPFANVMPYRFGDNMGNFELEASVESVPDIYTGFAASSLPYHVQSQNYQYHQHLQHHEHHQQHQHQHHQHQLSPEPTVHNIPQQLETLPINPSIPQTQPQAPSTRADLAQSTRLRHPQHPKLLAEQNPPVPRQNFRPIAVATGERNHVTASSRASQGTRQKRGGREKNSHLNPDARDRSSKMRKKGACWRCKLQRDPVSSVVAMFNVAFTNKGSAPTMVRLAGVV